MIDIVRIRYFQLNIPFKASFKHGSAERSETETVIVEVTDANGLVGYGEGCPRPYVTGESISSCHDFFRAYHNHFKKISALIALKAFIQNQKTEIDTNPAAWCAVELAILDLLAKEKSVPVETLLNIKNTRQSYFYSAVLGDSSPKSFASVYKQYRNMGFTDFKIKLSENLSKEKEKLQCLTNDLPEIVIRADANNLWTSKNEAVRYLNCLKFNFQSIEEPIDKNQYEELDQLAEELDLKIVLDESFKRFGQIRLLESNPSIWIVNIRVSKMGGILRSLEIIDALVAMGVEITIGAQVGETSLLTRAALILADKAEDNLRAQEGAFGTLLLERDLFAPVLQFGTGGILTDMAGLRSSPGFGLNLVSKLENNPNILCFSL